MGDVEVFFRHLNTATEEEIAKYKVASDIIPRPGFNTAGKEITLGVNSYPIAQFPTKTVYQYDVSLFTRNPRQAGHYIHCLFRFLLEMVSRNVLSSRRCGTRMPVKRKREPNSFSMGTNWLGKYRIKLLWQRLLIFAGL